MPEVQLPNKPKSQVVDLEIRHLILGCIIAGSTVAILALAVNASRERARLRRQQALLLGVERLLLLIQQIRRETPINPGTGTEGDH